jgi:hypothetical protein
MADALASGASKGNLVGVQVPPRPPTNQTPPTDRSFLCSAVVATGIGNTKHMKRSQQLFVGLVAIGTLNGCSPPVVVEIVNNTNVPVRVRVQVAFGNGTETIDAVISGGGRRAVDAKDMTPGTCSVTRLIEAAPGYTASGALWAPDPTWCDDSDDKVEQWLIEYQPGTQGTVAPVSNVAPPSNP